MQPQRNSLATSAWSSTSLQNVKRREITSPNLVPLTNQALLAMVGYVQMGESSASSVASEIVQSVLPMISVWHLQSVTEDDQMMYERICIWRKKKKKKKNQALSSVKINIALENFSMSSEFKVLWTDKEIQNSPFLHMKRWHIFIQRLTLPTTLLFGDFIKTAAIVRWNMKSYIRKKNGTKFNS